MDKETTSVKRAGFSKGKPGRLGPKATARPYDPTVSLRNPAIIQKAILQSLKDGDFESVMEIYKSHLRVLNRTKTADSLQVSRQYIHKMLREQAANPSLKTFSSFMRLLGEEVLRGCQAVT